MKRLGDPPFICLITEGRATQENYESESSTIVARVRDAVADGVNLIQIREKALGGRMLFDLTRRIVKAVAGTNAVIVVNDRADVASTAGADGVHLPESSLPPRAVRAKFPELLVGVSTHLFDAARTPITAGADYIFFGPVFATPGKDRPVGTAALADVCREAGTVPVIAIGGIGETNFDTTLEAGAAGIAAIRALNDADSRREICRRVKIARGGLR